MKRFGAKAVRFFSLFMVAFACLAASNSASAQVSNAAISGNVQDSSGAAVASATVTVTNLETGAVRTVTTDESGHYEVVSLPVGLHEVKVEKEGFSAAIQTGINLVVGQHAIVNLNLSVGTVQQHVTVSAEAPLVNTTTSSVSGLVGEQEIKDLPLNGRSFDNLITLNPAASNYTSQRTYGFSGVGNQFVVAGRRQWSNIFLLNGVEYTGAGVSTVTPGGVSSEMLGIDGIREFNVLSSSYSAEYGKRSGGQVNIVTQSGTNAIHGSAFEFLRNSALDARNFFDHPTGRRIPPFQRNQFGGALGGPIKKNKTFIFGNYEGFRQRLGLSLLTVVPNLNTRQGMLPCGIIVPLPSGCAVGGTTPMTVPGLVPGMLPFLQQMWPLPNGADLGGGVAQTFSNPKQSINEDFGTARFDQNFSERDNFSAVYTIDSGISTTPASDPFFAVDLYLRNQVLSLQETHTFSPHVINTATFGFSRAAFTYDYDPVVAIDPNLSWLAGAGPGSITIGGAQALSGGTLTNGLSAQTHGHDYRTLFTYQDGLQIIKGAHQISLGVFLQRIRSNEESTSKSLGQASFTNLQTFLQGITANFSIAPNHIPDAWRQLNGAWYVSDTFRINSRLTLTAGLRHEFTNGWNENTGRGAIFLFNGPNGAPDTVPLVVSQIYPQNDAKLLFAPRIGLAWDPFGTGKTAVRAGWGIYYDLVDSSLAGGPTNSNPPFNGAESFSGVPILPLIPVVPGVPLPPQCNVGVPKPCTLYQPKGNDPHLRTPTVQSWSLTVEQQLTKNTVLRVGYLGSQTYHQEINRDANSIVPLICSDSAGCASGGLNAKNPATTGHVPLGALYIPVAARPNPFLDTTLYTFFAGTANYNALTVDVERRFDNGLQFRGNYTWSRNLDDGSGIGTSTNGNSPLSVENPYNLRQDWGVSPLNVSNQASGNFGYDLPFGAGKAWLSGATGPVGKLVSGWRVGSIVTLASGLSVTPIIGANRSGNGDTSVNPDRPSLNAGFSPNPIHGVSAGCTGVPAGTVLGTAAHWYDPCAFSLPAVGTWGNIRRATMVGPGLETVDFSILKSTNITEGVQLQFRAEVFNILNRANFGLPNTTVFSGASLNASAGLIGTTTTTSRQIQFGLKLLF